MAKLLNVYREHIGVPWQQGLAGIQRVIFAVYDPHDELRMRANLVEFEIATKAAGHAWQLIDITDKAITEQRALLSNPDPVQALLDKATDLLRRSLNHHVQAFQDEYTKRLSSLQADDSWKKLPAADQTTVFKECGLEPAEMPDMSSAPALEQALEDCPLARWTDRREALASRFDQARLAAARKLMPTIRRVTLPSRPLNSAAEVKAWLAEAEAALLKELEQGPVIPG